jgi:hypothetical protein
MGSNGSNHLLAFSFNLSLMLMDFLNIDFILTRH